jgi:ATP-dependent DNA helicase RecG
MGIVSVLDLLMHYPRRYADRTNRVDIADATIGEDAVVSANIAKVALRRPRGNRRPIVEVTLDDGTGKLIATFFNQPWRVHQLEVGTNVVVFGRIDEYRKKLQVVNPIVDLVGDQTGRVVPIYPQSGRAGISSNELAGYLTEALERAMDFADPLPGEHRSRLGLLDRTTAFRLVHIPEFIGDEKPALRRLAFDELWRLQVALVMRKRVASEQARGIAHVIDAGPMGPSLVEKFLSGLPFKLTPAQQRVIGEIASDLGRAYPMHRLLQGDVGSGKTVVALAAMLYAVQGGHQGALMVPTEVLAEQHAFGARDLLRGLHVPDPARITGERPVMVALLTSRTPAGERSRLLEELRNGGVDIVIGTHALITEDVTFSSLGVVVVDEQHRFGVDQRAALREKGSLERLHSHDPDLLVMTATPIPRTAAMTVYGDLDYSVLDELPPGRMPISTTWVYTTSGEERVWEHVRQEVLKGHQAYVICSLVRSGEPDDDASLDESEGASFEPICRPVDADDRSGRLFARPGAEGDSMSTERRVPRAVVDEYERLRETELAGYSVAMLHGQLPSNEKEEVMASFRAGAIDILVATTVVEVGVDVTRATIVVIEDADRFGISQLHQLRGRVGRAKEPSYCYLLAESPTEAASQRIDALVSTLDGFELAEADLRLRGEGTVLGVRQKGRNELKLASLASDRDLVVSAREVAESIVAEDPTLEGHPVLAEELRLFVGEAEAEYLMKS